MATTAISESLIWMKATFLLADLILMGVLIRVLTTTGMGTARALIYGWSPLVTVEVSGNGHNDVLALARLMATYSGILHDRSTLSMCFLRPVPDFPGEPWIERASVKLQEYGPFLHLLGLSAVPRWSFRAHGRAVVKSGQVEGGS